MNVFKTANVILHAFDWPYALVAQRADEITAAGYKSVLVSPPMKSLKHAQGTKWWQRYQPQDYRVIDNQLGDTRSFKDMVEALNQRSIYVYADVVFNHMANESQSRLDLQYPDQSVLESYQLDTNYYENIKLFGDLSEPLFAENDFVEAFGIEDWQDKWQVQNGRITGGPADPGLPTLRVHEHVIKQQQAYLCSLKSLGVKGFRIDAAKHMSLEHLQKVWSKEICEDVHIFGEIITDGGATKLEYDLFLEPFLAETRLGAYDFPLFQTMFDALEAKGSLKSLVNPYCFGQALSQSRAITFAITHDIPNNDVFANLVMPEKTEWLAYSYILGRDGGVPLIYTDLDTCGLKGSDGRPRWLNAWNDKRMTSRIRFYNLMHGKTMQVMEASDDLLIFARGDEGIVIINKSKRPQRVQIAVSGKWLDLLSEEHYLSQQGTMSISVAGEESLMLVKS
ncbi:alpha-amylase family protein [Vibrio sp. Isolate24]|uniref:alpha-amylase family protein n=1 Tax=Vibrio sp. Isolate24 TaxID=2908534 RepID=UPI001EFE9DEA|nr:alpha-amylase family protein [Vibrio sp. Isolate24]MCG9677479.1 alpha-amylase family protein [Vibrio sp. Isolate24]